MSESFIISGGMRVALRRSGRARRMILRVRREDGQAVLTLPRHVPLTEGRAFAEAKREWLQRAAARVPTSLRAEWGARLPVEGQSRELTAASVRTATLDGGRLLLPAGRPAGAVTEAFLKYLAHERLRRACDTYVEALGLSYGALVLRDTRSRWGSCTSGGRLMFSWRLAMAPPDVLDYVAAHEVAHLVHMDHSLRFWKQVEALMPGYGAHRTWLRRNGADLLIWKFRD